jgi:hypothetical protein
VALRVSNCLSNLLSPRLVQLNHHEPHPTSSSKTNYLTLQIFFGLFCSAALRWASVVLDTIDWIIWLKLGTSACHPSSLYGCAWTLLYRHELQLQTGFEVISHRFLVKLWKSAYLSSAIVPLAISAVAPAIILKPVFL